MGKLALRTTNKLVSHTTNKLVSRTTNKLVARTTNKLVARTTGKPDSRELLCWVQHEEHMLVLQTCQSMPARHKMNMPAPHRRSMPAPHRRSMPAPHSHRRQAWGTVAALASKVMGPSAPQKQAWETMAVLASKAMGAGPMDMGPASAHHWEHLAEHNKFSFSLPREDSPHLIVFVVCDLLG